MGRSARGDVRPEARGEGLCADCSVRALCLSQHSCVFKQMAGFDRLTRGGRVGKVEWIKTGVGRGILMHGRANGLVVYGCVRIYVPISSYIWSERTAPE